MRIEDIIRIALNKAVREYSRGYYASMFVSRNAPRERFLHYLDISLVFQFWRNVHLIGQKRRPWKKGYVVPSLDEILEQLSRLPVEISKRKTYGGIRAYDIKFSNNTIQLVDGPDGCGIQIWCIYGNEKEIVGEVIRDMVEIMVKVNDALNDLPSLVEKVYKASHSNYKSEEILLASAHVLINDMNIPPEIRVMTSVDKTGLISTLVSKGGYQKQCKSTLETLQANILKTITLVTQYRFTGYIEEV
jgi:hypothetical protein